MGLIITPGRPEPEPEPVEEEAKKRDPWREQQQRRVGLMMWQLVKREAVSKGYENYAAHKLHGVAIEREHLRRTWELQKAATGTIAALDELMENSNG